jgi:pimeloyl-ACP methyl ester carboxylesterase
MIVAMLGAPMCLSLASCRAGNHATAVGAPPPAPTTRKAPLDFNPSFPITAVEARERMRDLQAQPKPLQRPLVILGGFLDPGFGPDRWKAVIDRSVDGTIITITFSDLYSFQSFRERVVKTLDEQVGDVDPDQTVEVDVIGQSMGGLTALYSSLDDPKLGKRLRIKRLFTISSPLTGSKLAMLTPFNVFAYQADMRPESLLLRRITAAKYDFPIYSYTRLDDTTVGEMFASLPGIGVWWLDNPPGERAHIGIFRDPRVLLDIILRLRGETPITRSPPAPLPTTHRLMDSE